MSVFLQERINEQIRIHELKPMPEKIYDYKKGEMRQIPLNMRLFRAQSSDGDIRPLEENHSINYQTLGFKGEKSCEHEMVSPRLTEEEFSRQNKILEDYYRNCKPNETVIEVCNNTDKDIHYLLPLGRYVISVYDMYYIENVLNIPESLFKLNEFLKGKFDSLTEDEIKEMLKLFSVDILDTIDISSLKRFSELGIIIPDYEEQLNRKINASAGILKLIKK